MKRIMRKHLNTNITIDTYLGRKMVICKIHKGLAVTPSLNPKVPGYRVMHVATGKIVTEYTFKLNQAWSVLLALEPLTDWTMVTMEDMVVAACGFSGTHQQGFYESVRRIVQREIAE